MTIPYEKFMSLSPTLHPVCSSDLVSEHWISILMPIILSKNSRDWRNQAGPQFQLLSDLCRLANKTIDDAIRRFIKQSFITSNVLTKFDFDTQLNTTLDQFFQSTIIYFSQLIDTVRLLMQVDQPLIQLGPVYEAPLTNVFIAFVTDETNGEQSPKVCY
jgi:hypothetical protein